MNLMNLLGSRILRAAKLEAQLYEEVEADRSALPQAMLIVVLSSLAAGIASLGEQGFFGLVIGAVAALLSWYVWAFIIYIIGARLLPEPQTKADHGELLRTLGYASAPGLIRVVGIVPGIQTLAFLAASIWMLAATVIAVRQALDYKSTWRAVGVCVLGWLIQMLVFMAIIAIFDLQPGT